MTIPEFNFSNAIFHIFRTGGPKGFLWKFALAYGVCGMLMYALMGWAFAPIFASMFNPDVANDPDAMDALVLENMGRIFGGYAIIMVAALLLWIMFEAASQRRYMRGDGFGLRFSADEGRLLVLGLIFFGIFLATYIGLFVVMALVIGTSVAVSGDSGAGAGLAGVLMFVLMIAYFVGLLFIMVRLSPAAALTIRDRKIRFSSAWRVSKGKGWAIFGSWMLQYLIMYGVMIVVYLIVIALAFATVMPSLMGSGGAEDPAEVLAALSTPGALVTALVAGFLLSAVGALFLHAFDGPAALAAKTDPEWVNQDAIGDTFG
ncbi:MAG: hypothetical protein R3C00_13970 [Hyphomonas sp.]|nr:hypothetical protein [Hyphomonas sp.]